MQAEEARAKREMHVDVGRKGAKKLLLFAPCPHASPACIGSLTGFSHLAKRKQTEMTSTQAKEPVKMRHFLPVERCLAQVPVSKSLKKPPS